MFYDYLLGRWQFAHVSPEYLKQFVPRYISEEERLDIISQPQK